MTSDRDQLDHPPLFWLRLRLGLLSGAFRLVVTLFTLVKWAFAPAVLLFQLLVYVPIAKNLRISLEQSCFEPIDESELPDDVWVRFRQLAAKFSLLGFTPGAIARINESMPNQRAYNRILINPQLSTAIGINAMHGLDKRGKVVIEKHFEELSAERPGGGYIDFSNTTEEEPIAPTSRQRVLLPAENEITLYRLFREYARARSCTLTANTLEALQREPLAYFYNEYREGLLAMMAKGHLQEGPQPNTLEVTWKGALFATFMGNWPLVELARRNRERNNQALFEAAGIDREQLDSFDMAELLPPLPWTDEAAMDLSRLITLLKPITQAFSPALRLFNVQYTFGTGSDRSPDTIRLEYVLYETFPARNLVRYAILHIGIDSRSGRMQSLMIEDDHAALDEVDKILQAYFEAVLPDPISVIPPRKAMENAELALADVRPDSIDDLSLTLSQAKHRPIWNYTFFGQYGKPQGITLDAVSGAPLQPPSEEETAP